MKQEELAVPKINNLYNNKSRLLIEKLKRTYRTDNKSILPLSFLSLIGFSVAGHVVLGVYVMLLMIGMYFLNRKNLASLEEISIATTSYEYLLEYREMFVKLKRFYTRLLGFGLPLAAIVGYFIFFRSSPLLHDFLQMKIGHILGILLGLSLILSALGVLAYRLSLKIVYGRFIQKLEEMIADMSELRK